MVNLQKICRRQNHRFVEPVLDVSLNGLEGRSSDWSLGGLAVRFADDQGKALAPDAKVSGDLGEVDGTERFPFSARVVRFDPRRDVVALEFSKLSEGAVMMFVRSFRHMISGAA